MNRYVPLVFAGLMLLPIHIGMAQGVHSDSGSALPELGDISASTLSPQMERRIGEEAMREIRADPSYADDPEVDEYLNRLGSLLASSGVGARQDFEFFLVKDSTINAFALPGGFVGVHAGLIVASQTESELASVLAHEISHVTQRHIARMFGKQSQLSTISLAGIILGILSARSNSQVGQAALVASQAGAVQAQLNYTRDYEREADRVGFDRLQQAGFDTGGMVSFFERLQKANRIYENNAPAYLQTHPLTGERIADIQNRSQSVAYRQHVDGADFQLVRAKIRAEQGTPREAVTYFEGQLREGRFSNESGARFGLVSALVRAREFSRADTEMKGLRAKTVNGQPLVEMLDIKLKTSAGDNRGAMTVVRDALKRYANYRPLQYASVRTLQALGMHQEALAQVGDLVKLFTKDARLYRMQAESYAAIGKGLLQHQALAESYFLQGALPAAIEQLQLAQKAGDGDFYQLSAVEARLREIRARNAEEMRIRQ